MIDFAKDSVVTGRWDTIIARVGMVVKQAWSGEISVLRSAGRHFGVTHQVRRARACPHGCSDIWQRRTVITRCCCDVAANLEEPWVTSTDCVVANNTAARADYTQ